MSTANVIAASIRYGMLGLLAGGCLVACSRSSEPVQAAPKSTPAPVPAVASAEVHPDQWPALTSPLPVDAALEARVRDLLATMTIEEKVGQIVQADFGSVTPEDVRRYRLGSVLGGGNSDPGGRYNAAPAEWLAMLDAFHRASMDTSGGGKAIPVLIGIDAVHGHNNVVGATLFPHNIGLGAAGDADLVRRIAEVTAIELRVTGFEWTFAPTLTVPRDDRWGRTYEGYSENPEIVARFAGAVVEGLQGKVGSAGFLDDAHVLASAKHFIGDGGTHDGKDQGDTRVSEAELRDIHGAGYGPALSAGTQTVMASFSGWNGQKIHGHKGLLTDVLKQRMGFDGFVVGDWNAHGQVPGCSNENCAAAFVAGVDLLMAPDSWRGYYTNALAQARSGEIPMQRLDDAVTRILRVKFRLGLFDAPPTSERRLSGKFEQLAAPAHRALAREAVRKSLVLLKNNGGVLPLRPGGRYLVAGDGADDIGKQAGGWTLSWQGTGNTRADFPNADSIYDGIAGTVAAAGGKAELSVDGSYTRKPDAAIVVFGESPYAEFQGDVADLAYRSPDDRDLALLRRLKAAGVPVVAVFLSGRPLFVSREINAADAFVAAWLPGSEGGGVADVLFANKEGGTAHDFTGRLSFSWPKTAAQSPLNVGQANYDPAFAFGYGLSYAQPKELAALPEDDGLDDKGGERGVYYARGASSPGWALTLADDDATAVAADTLPATSAGGRVSVRKVDHAAQEDALRLTWSGSGSARVALDTPTPIDLDRERNGDVLLVLTLQTHAVPAGAIELGQRCGSGCAGFVDVGDALRALPAGEWKRLGVPLKCFGFAGANMSAISSAFELRTAAALDVSLSRVALGTGAEYDQALRCPAP